MIKPCKKQSENKKAGIDLLIDPGPFTKRLRLTVRR
jgi:hypothetical protein